MDRFSEIRVFCNANVPNSNNDSINITVTGLDTIYSQSFSGTTGPIGLVTFGKCLRLKIQDAYQKDRLTGYH
ncbi:MAG: hypothetical protein IPL53_03995 [Ignavibacteria bacterium]|nr:hypothetical protein [Ignavibacteria bacterium]